MIIDVHRHLVAAGTVQGDYIRGAQKSFAMMYRKTHNVEISDREFTQDVVRPLIDPQADNIIEEMDAAGVDKTIIFGVDYGLLFGEAPIHIFDQNKLYADAAKRHEDRLIPFMAIDPRRKGALKHCEQAYNEWGMKGFKLHAGVGYMPDDPVCYWIYEKAAEWNIPIMVHTGGAPSVAPALGEFTPGPFCDSPPPVIRKSILFLPIAAMSGGGRKPSKRRCGCQNVYVDLSLWQKPYKKLPKKRFYQWLRDIIDIAGADKIMFATDALYPNLMCPLAEWVQAFKERETDIEFSDEEINLILGERRHGKYCDID